MGEQLLSTPLSSKSTPRGDDKGINWFARLSVAWIAAFAAMTF
jgi:hypothetical protein